MNYQKLGEDIYIPKRSNSALQDSGEIKFNYYLDSRINGNWIDLDITSKLFGNDKMFVRKSCYRVRLGEIENCVKANIIDHMRCLGVPKENIPESLFNKTITNQSSGPKPMKVLSD